MLLNLPLSRSQLDRAAHLRADSAGLDELWRAAKVISMVGDKLKTTADGLAFIDPISAPGERYFLGLDKSGTPYFVTHQSAGDIDLQEFQSLRTIGASINSLMIGS